jgi:hypothetical protein
MDNRAEYITSLTRFPLNIAREIELKLPHWWGIGQNGTFVGHLADRLRAKGLKDLANEVEGKTEGSVVQ